MNYMAKRFPRGGHTLVVKVRGTNDITRPCGAPIGILTVNDAIPHWLPSQDGLCESEALHLLQNRLVDLPAVLNEKHTCRCLKQPL